jgi:hypothetical protein
MLCELLRPIESEDFFQKAHLKKNSREITQKNIEIEASHL